MLKKKIEFFLSFFLIFILTFVFFRGRLGSDDLQAFDFAYNFVNNNINSTQLSNRLLPNATSQLLGSLTNDMVFNLVKSVNDKLPASLRSTLNLNRLTEIFTGVAGTAVGKGITSSVSNYSNQLLSGNFKVGSVLGDLNNLLD